jgi:nucleotide-binding universal stress UspA family protein
VAPNGYCGAAAAPVSTIAVGYDHSPEAAAALDATLAIARALGARVRVIEVIEAMMTGFPAMMAGPGYNTPPGEHDARVQADLEKLVAQLPSDVDVEPVAVPGDAQYRLAEESEKVDLIVVGSRGYGPHNAVLLGSVSGRLVRHAACPVVVVPRGIEAPLERLFSSDRVQAV